MTFQQEYGGRPKHPPQVMSARRGSVHWSPLAGEVAVFLDGRLITQPVVEANAQERFIEVIMTTEAGKVAMDDAGEEITYRREGRVEIKWRDEV